MNSPAFPLSQFPTHFCPSPTASIPIADNATPKPNSSPLHRHSLQPPEGPVELAVVAEAELVAVVVEAEVDLTPVNHMSVMKILDLVGIYSPGLVIAVVAVHGYSVEGDRKVDSCVMGAL